METAVHPISRVASVVEESKARSSGEKSERIDFRGHEKSLSEESGSPPGTMRIEVLSRAAPHHQAHNGSLGVPLEKIKEISLLE